jgi:hypothetical protein
MTLVKMSRSSLKPKRPRERPITPHTQMKSRQPKEKPLQRESTAIPMPVLSTALAETQKRR